MAQHDGNVLKKMILSSTQEAVMEIVETMLFIPVTAGHGVAKPSGVAHVAAPAEASVMLGFNGGLNGGARLACSVNVARALASALAGETFRIMNDDAKDAFAEIGNMVAGGIQTRLTDRMRMGEVNMTPPTVIIGGDYEVDFKSSLESVRQFFRLEDEPFYIEIFYMLEQKSTASVSLDSQLFGRLERLVGKYGETPAEVIAFLVEHAV
jgi:chemotaxis protein CheX